MNFSRLIRSIWHTFMFAADHLIFLVPPRKIVRSRDVLIIKPDKLGDFVVWLDAASEYRKCFKGLKLILLLEQSLASLAKEVGIFDEVFPFSFSKFGENIVYRLKTLVWLRRRGFHSVVAISRSFRYVDVMVRFASSTEKIGPNGNEALMRTQPALRFSNKWYSKIIKLKKRRETNAFELNLSFVEALGSEVRNPRLPILDKLAGMAFNKLIGNSYAVFVLGAASSLRKWPLESFALLGQRFLCETPYSIVLVGTPSERLLAQRFVSRLGGIDTNRVIDETGKTDLMDLISVLSNAMCVVSNETGTLHLAAAVGTPSICIAGGGDFGHLVPYPEVLDACEKPLPITIYEQMSCFGCGWQCIYDIKNGAPAPCVSAVSVDVVWKNLIDVMQLHRNK